MIFSLMPHVIHRIGRAIVRNVPMLLEARVASLFKRLKRPEDEEIETVLRTGERMLISMQEHAGFHIYIRGQHQPYVLKHLHEHLRPGMAVFDVGAHFGLITLTAASTVGSSGSVHSFEPGKKQLRFLRHNIGLSSFSSFVHVNEVAVSDKPGMLGYVEGKTLGGSRVTADFDGNGVTATTLDAYCEENGIEEVDLLKIDVEGHELQVLNGFLRAMDSTKPPRLVLYECDENTCQNHGYSAKDLHMFMLDRGYEIKKARGGTITTSNAGSTQWQNDFLAVRSP